VIGTVKEKGERLSLLNLASVRIRLLYTRFFIVLGMLLMNEEEEEAEVRVGAFAVQLLPDYATYYSTWVVVLH